MLLANCALVSFLGQVATSENKSSVKEEKQNEPVSTMTITNLTNIPEEELQSCFTTFPGCGDELKRIDFVLVHQVNEEDAAGSTTSLNANSGDKDAGLTNKQMRRFFKNNLFSKGLRLKLFVSSPSFLGTYLLEGSVQFNCSTGV